MLTIKKLTIAAVFLGAISSTALADQIHPSSHFSEGLVSVKIRGGYMMVNDSTSNNANVSDTFKFKNGFTGEAAIGYFITDHMAVEGSAGYGMTKMSVNNVPAGTTAPNKSSVGLIPITALLQYYFIPDATVSPYVGIGGSYQFATGGPSNFKVQSGAGLTGQIGFDVLFDDVWGLNTIGFNFDVKHTHDAQHNIKVSAPYTNTGNAVTVKNKMSTTTAMAGIVFQF
jgi:outer membrane protein W